MKLSIVIPVYKVEKTLDRCIRSVIAQACDDMEIILVDDGSPDNCPSICDQWAVKDNRIKVIHKPNGGLSDARNAGIKIANGKYITFVDSDDYLSPGTYKSVLSLMNDDIDIIEYSIKGKLILPEYTYENMEEYWLNCKAYTHTYACNKIYNRNLFNDICFPKGRIFEDIYTLPQLLKKTKRIKTTSLGFYNYCLNLHGITANADGKDLKLLLEAHLNSGMPIDDVYYMYLVNIQIDVWEKTGEPLILPYRKINIENLEGKHKIKAIAINTLGISTLCKISKLLHIIKKPSQL